MNATQAENLRILIRHMETKVRGNLEMRDSSSATCGTPVCAWGHAQTIGTLKAQISYAGDLTGMIVPMFGMTSEGGPSYWGRLFGSGLGQPGTGRTYDPTPQQWATEARKVLAENGYSMDDAPAKDDGFGAFMAKVREPVAVEV